jgi:hypothetical protein
MGASGSSRRIDPGWLFVAAGLTLCVVGVLIPAQQSLGELHARGQDGIEAHERFLERLGDRDPAVIRRLAAAQLNLTPAGDTPVLVASSRRSTVMDWIGRSVVRASVTAAPATRSWLTALTDGTRRLWVLGVGVVLVFVGLLVDGRTVVNAAPVKRPVPSIPRWQPEDADEPDVTDEVEWSENADEEQEDGAWNEEAGEAEEEPDEADEADEADEEEDEDEDDEDDDEVDEEEDDDGEWEEGEDSEWEEEDDDEDEEDDDDEEEEKEA